MCFQRDRGDALPPGCVSNDDMEVGANDFCHDPTAEESAPNLFDRDRHPECRNRERCPRYGRDDPRRAASEAVEQFSGGEDSARFYVAFAEAWGKATTAGQRNLLPLVETCETENNR